MDLRRSKKLEKKIRKNQFDFEDFKQQLEQIKKMGNIKDLLGMIPGVGKAVKDVDISDDSFKGIEAIINSMTVVERRNPDILKASRKKRIASGSGTKVEEINKLLKMHRGMADMMKAMGGAKRGPMAQIANAMGFGGGMPSAEEMQKMAEKLQGGAGGGLPPGMPNLPKNIPGLPGLGGAKLPGLGGFPGLGKKK